MSSESRLFSVYDRVLFYWRMDDTAALVVAVASDCVQDSCLVIRQGWGFGNGALLRKLTNDCFGSYLLLLCLL